MATLQSLLDEFNEVASVLLNSISGARITRQEHDKLTKSLRKTVASFCDSIYDLAVKEASKVIEEIIPHRSKEVFAFFMDNNLFSISVPTWRDVMKHQLQTTFKFVSAPGRSVTSIARTLQRAIYDASYAGSLAQVGGTIINIFRNQAERDAVSFLSAESSGRVRLVYNDDGFEICKRLQGVYDYRFLPETPFGGCTCSVEVVDVDEDRIVYVDNEPVVIPMQEEIREKRKTLNSVSSHPDGAAFVDILTREIEFMEEAYRYFVEENVASRGLSDELEALVSYIYGGEITSFKAPVDVITPVFGIEVKAATVADSPDKERGHMAQLEVSRKYAYLEALKKQGITEGYHKYVLGVFDYDKDLVTIYEQNYFSNKHSGTMIPVAQVRNLSKIKWVYESTPYREFRKVSLANDPDIIYFRKPAKYDPTFYEVVRLDKENINDNTGFVIDFDRDKPFYREGRVSEEDGLVRVDFNDGETITLTYDEFNSRFRYVVASTPKTLAERGLPEVTIDLDTSPIPVRRKKEIIAFAESVL